MTERVFDFPDIDEVKKPLRENIEKAILSEDKLCQVLTLRMGEGKTHEFGNIAYKLFELGVRVLPYIFPQNDLYDKIETEKSLESNGRGSNYFKVLAKNPSIKNIQKYQTGYIDRIIIAPMTWAYQNRYDIVKILDEIYSPSILASINEEGHHGGASSKERLQDVSGYKSEKFQGKQHSAIIIMKEWKYCQLNTATPTIEHSDPNSDTYRIIPNDIKALDLAMNKGYYRHHTVYRFDPENPEFLEEAKRVQVENLMERNRQTKEFKEDLVDRGYDFAIKIKPKILSQTLAKSDTSTPSKIIFGSSEWHIDFYDKQTRSTYDDNGFILAATGENGYYPDPHLKTTRSYKTIIGNYGLYGTKNDYYLDEMNNTNSPLADIVTKQMGRMGINCVGLKSQFFSTEPRSHRKVNNDKEYIFTSTLQRLGRLVRLNLGGLKWSEFDRLEPKDQIEFIQLFNTYEFFIPNDPHMVEATRVFRANYSLDVNEVFRKYFKKRTYFGYV